MCALFVFSGCASGIISADYLKQGSEFYIQNVYLGTITSFESEVLDKFKNYKSKNIILDNNECREIVHLKYFDKQKSCEKIQKKNVNFFTCKHKEKSSFIIQDTQKRYFELSKKCFTDVFNKL